MLNSVQSCLPVVFKEEGEQEEKIIYDLDEGYSILPADADQADLYDQFAAAQISPENYSTTAEFIENIGAVSDPEIEARVKNMDKEKGAEAEISINGENYDAEPNAAFLYATIFPKGELETDETFVEDLSEENIDDERLPDQENWFEPDLSSIDRQEIDLDDDYDKVLEFDGYDMVKEQTPHGLIINHALKFVNGGNDFSITIPDGVVAAEDQFKRDLKKNLENGEYGANSPYSAAAISAWPEKDLEIEDMDYLDVYSIAVAILDSEEIEVDNYVIEQQTPKVVTDMDGDIVEAPVEFVGAMYPALKDTLKINGIDLRNANLGVDQDSSPNIGVQ